MAKETCTGSDCKDPKRKILAGGLCAPCYSRARYAKLKKDSGGGAAC